MRFENHTKPLSLEIYLPIFVLASESVSVDCVKCTPIETFPGKQTNKRKSINWMPFALGCSLTKSMWNFARMEKKCSHLHPLATCVLACALDIEWRNVSKQQQQSDVWVDFVDFFGGPMHMSKRVNTHVSEWTNRPNGSNGPIAHTHTRRDLSVSLRRSLIQLSAWARARLRVFVYVKE